MRTYYIGAGVAQPVKCLTTDWMTGRSGFDTRPRRKDISSNLCVKPALGPTQPPVQWVPRVLSPGQSAAGAWRWPLTPIYCRGQEWIGAISPFPPSATMACRGTALLCFFTYYIRTYLHTHHESKSQTEYRICNVKKKTYNRWVQFKILFRFHKR
jgi:hypothetical protein